MKHTYFYSVLNNRCPRCRKGNIFISSNAYKLSNTTKMKEQCDVCGQPTEIEVGFYYGTGYVSYALSVAFSVATFFAWWVLIGFSLDDTRFFWWMGTNAVAMIVLQPLFMRLSRSIWLSWFVKYDKDWEKHPLESFERIVPNQEG
ncbi:MAG: multidrug effflux MFS transporter [Bacteroidetes bacterium]|nr:multidrug effflux MFS transporter [Bacteroidota bacterium]